MQNSAARISFGTWCSKIDKKKKKGSTFETFWVLSNSPKGTKFCLQFSIHALCQRIAGNLAERLEIRESSGHE